ncbi:hypothetical protein [Actinacidiphila paucisporea]|nr:hypothetical protein [Actinacidiphila paucisporea]
MSMPPPDQPGSNPYQNPQPSGPPGPPPGQIPGQPPAGGFGAPVPPQHNPYAQAPSPYGSPQPAYYGPPQQPGALPAGGSGGGVGKAVLWAVVGAVVASMAWGGGVLLLGKDSGKADLRGYSSKKNLCDTADLSAFKTEYPKPDADPTSYTSDRPTLVQMFCSESLDKDTSDTTSYSYAYVSIEADLHRKSDPTEEFGDHWKSFEDHGSGSTNQYKVTAVDGFGDEAYLVTQDTVSTGSDGEESGSRESVLAVRDGWMTFTLSWNGYASTLDKGTDKVATLDQATAWVKTAAKATMAKLK